MQQKDLPDLEDPADPLSGNTSYAMKKMRMKNWSVSQWYELCGYLILEWKTFSGVLKTNFRGLMKIA